MTFRLLISLGNKITQGTGWRVKFFMLLPELHEKHVAFHRVDEQDIEVDEIVQGWKLSAAKDPGADAKNFHFRVLTFLRLPKDCDPNSMTELDFSSSALSSVDLRTYPKLVTVSLANNELKSLEGSGIRTLSYLEGLDLRKNKLKDIDTICDEIKSLPKLKTLFIDENVGYPVDDAENRTKFLARMMSLVDPTMMALEVLNGKKVTLLEKVKAFKRIKNAPYNVVRDISKYFLILQGIYETGIVLKRKGYQAYRHIP
jgi:hypothetical protein